MREIKDLLSNLVEKKTEYHSLVLVDVKAKDSVDIEFKKLFSAGENLVFLKKLLATFLSLDAISGGPESGAKTGNNIQPSSSETDENKESWCDNGMGGTGVGRGGGRVRGEGDHHGDHNEEFRDESSYSQTEEKNSTTEPSSSEKTMNLNAVSQRSETGESPPVNGNNSSPRVETSTSACVSTVSTSEMSTSEG